MKNDCSWKNETYNPEKDGYLLSIFCRILAWFISIKISPFCLFTPENTFRIIDPHSISRTPKAPWTFFSIVDDISKK